MAFSTSGCSLATIAVIEPGRYWSHVDWPIAWRPNTSRRPMIRAGRSEEHTSELQSPCNLVCRLLLEKKKNKHKVQFRSNSEERHLIAITIKPLTIDDITPGTQSLRDIVDIQLEYIKREAAHPYHRVQ